MRLLEPIQPRTFTVGYVSPDGILAFHGATGVDAADIRNQFKEYLPGYQLTSMREFAETGSE